MLYQYDQEWVDDEGRRRISYDYRQKRNRRVRNQYAQQFFKKRRPRIKLFPGMPLKINQNKSKTSNDLDHEIQSIKTRLKEQQEELNLDIDQIDQDLLGEIDLSISEQIPQNKQLKILMKNNKLISVIDLQKEEERLDLDIGRQKIKQNLLLPDDILNPTHGEIHQALQAIKSQFKHSNPFNLISKLYEDVIVKKRPLNEFLHPFWTRQRDEQLLNLFIKYMSIERASHSFSLDHNNIKIASIANRLQLLLKKGMIRYNQQVQVFKSSLTNLNKIGDGVVGLILSNYNKIAIQAQILLAKLYLSVRVDRQFFYQVASKINLLFQSTVPVLRPK